MKVLISGAGIAGLTLAYWLRQYGHDPVMVEKAPRLRDEGFMIDFFGTGYTVSELMGILPALQAAHHTIPSLVFVDTKGREKFSISYASFRRLVNNRHLGLMRGDLEQILYTAIRDRVPVRFSTTVKSFRQDPDHVNVELSDGTSSVVDLLVGADGVHSGVRRLAFGEEEHFARFLGYYAAAFLVDEPPPSVCAQGACILTLPRRQVTVYPIHDGKLATFFVYKAGDHRPSSVSFETAAQELRAAFSGLGWIVPELLDRCNRSSLYFDAVSQIEMPRWSTGRVVLVGDACQCVSLLAGQGASMAMASAYVLAGEIAKSGDDLAVALIQYERRMKPSIMKKQEAGRRLGHWFVPETWTQLAVRDLITRIVTWPVAWRFMRRALATESIPGLR